MALDFDTSSPVDDSRLRALVEAIRQAPVTESEPHWLEWKSSVDLDSAGWRGTLARHMIGFANRDPQTAQQVMGGFGYLALGVAPSELIGVEPIDNADLLNALNVYVDPSRVRWLPHWVALGERTVLVLQVEPPRPGDPIATLRRAYSDGKKRTWDEGSIFVRRAGQTVRPSTGELDMLTQRAGVLGRPPATDLHVVARQSAVYAVVRNPWNAERFTLRSYGFCAGNDALLQPVWRNGSIERVLQRGDSDNGRVMAVEPEPIRGTYSFVAAADKAKFDARSARFRRRTRLVRFFGCDGNIDLEVRVGEGYLATVAVLADARDRVELPFSYGVADDNSLVIPFSDEGMTRANEEAAARLESMIASLPATAAMGREGSPSAESAWARLDWPSA